MPGLLEEGEIKKSGSWMWIFSFRGFILEKKSNAQKNHFIHIGGTL